MRRPAINWNLLLNEMNDLLHTNPTVANFDDWLNSWSHLASMAHNDYCYWLLVMHQDYTDQQKQPYFHKILAERLPDFERINHKLACKLLDSDLKDKIPTHLKNTIENYASQHSDHIELRKKELLLIYDYQKLTCQHILSDEHPNSLVKARSMLCQCTDRHQREKLWREIQQSQAHLIEKTASVLIKLIQVRNKIAKNAGHEHYIDYLWSSKDIADYSIKDANLLLDNTAQLFNNIEQEYHSSIQEQLNIEQLQPWDLDISSSTAHLDQDQHTQDDCIRIGTSALGLIDSDFSELIFKMSNKRNINFSSGNDQNSQGLACFYTNMDEQFIVVNLNQHFTDAKVIMNTFGQSIHAHYSNQDNHLFWMKKSTATVSYLIAYIFQVLGLRHLNTEQIKFLNISSHQDFNQAILQHSCQWIQDLASQARFEHWLYAHIDQIQSANDLNQAYLNICPPQDPIWQEFKTEWSYSWNSWALLDTPFESTEHLMTWLSAMRFLKKYDAQPKETLTQFKHLLSLGRTIHFKEALETLGLPLSFKEQDLKAIQDIVLREYHSSSFSSLQKRNAV